MEARGIEGFSKFIAGLGFEPPRIEPGQFTRFSTNGQRSDKAGYCKMFADGDGGIVGDFRSGETHIWQARRERPRTEAEQRAFAEKIEREKKTAQEQREREEKQAAERAAAIWKDAKPSDDTHPYLARKGIKSYGLRVYSGPLVIHEMRCDGALIVPMRDATGALCSLQFISALTVDNKRFLGPTKDRYFSIGKPDPDGVLCIAEGYATGTSIHEATGYAVAVAFNAGNLEAVARALRDKFPDVRLILCADDDYHNKVNKGLTKATEAAQAVGGLLAVPDFGADRPEGAKDFNDLALHRGAEAVERAIANAQAPVKGEASPGEWPEPMPLQRPMPEPTPFSVDALGGALGGAAKKMAEAIQAPMAICGNSVLAAAALAAQAHADVVIDGRVFPLSEFFLTIGESGERKSAVDKVALWPHRKHEDNLRKTYSVEFSKHQRDTEAYSKARDEELKKCKGYEAKKKALAELGDAPEKPLEPHVICEEPTYEGLVKMLAPGQPSVGLFSDEGGRFIGGHGMNSDNLLKTAAGMSGLWDGKPISRVRAGDGAALLPGRRVSCHLMAQPDVSRLMLSNAVLLEQGLLSRCLVTWPSSTAGTRLYREIDLSASPELKRYSARMLAMLETPLLCREGSRNELNPRRLPLDADAKRVWIAFHDAVESRLADGGELAPIKGLANKAPEHAARLAGVLAIVDNISCCSISLNWIKAGIALTTHYINEALRLFDSGVSEPQLVNAEKLLQWLKQRKDKNGAPDRYVSLVEIYQNGPGAVRTAKAARQLMKILEDHAHATPYLDGVEYAGKVRREAWKVRE